MSMKLLYEMSTEHEMQSIARARPMRIEDGLENEVQIGRKMT